MINNVGLVLTQVISQHSFVQPVNFDTIKTYYKVSNYMYNTIGIDFIGFVCTHNSQKIIHKYKKYCDFFLHIYQI